MKARRLLIVTYYFPPNPAVGAHRWSAMADYFGRLGQDVHVVTTSAFGHLPSDATMVTRTRDLIASAGLRHLLRRPPLPAPGMAGALETPAPRLLSDVVVPDAYLASWNPAAYRAASRIVDELAVDCVITSGPPHSTHLTALALGRRRPAWVADFRDGWRFEPLRGAWPSRGQDRLDAWLERRVARSADRIVAATRPIADDFDTRLGVEAAHVSNGWDPDLDAGIEAGPRPSLDDAAVNVVHTGQFGGIRGRDPEPVFSALRKVAADPAARPVRLVLAGRLDADEKHRLGDPELQGLVTHVGQLSRRDSVALQRGADALLLATSTGHASVATGKVFEYLASGRPIIALADGNEAARIVTETRTGVTIAPRDVDAIADALRAARDGALERRYAPTGLERYRYPVPAEALLEQVERAIARSTRSRHRST